MVFHCIVKRKKVDSEFSLIPANSSLGPKSYRQRRILWEQESFGDIQESFGDIPESFSSSAKKVQKLALFIFFGFLKWIACVEDQLTLGSCVL